MKKKALFLIIIAPFVYLYGLVENHFVFGMKAKSFTLEYFYEYVNCWRVLLGKEHKDYSLKVAEYEFKLKAKAAKFDVDAALDIQKIWTRHWIWFDKKKRCLVYDYRSERGDETLSIKQINNDEFKIFYYDGLRWGRKRKLQTEYVFSRQQMLETVKILKN